MASVALAGLLIAGLRGPNGDTLAISQAAQVEVKAPVAAAESDLRFVPADAVAVFSIRPAAIFEQAEMKPLFEMFNQQLGLQEQLGVRLEQIEEILVIPWTKPEDIAYDPAKPLPKFGGRHPAGFLTSLADGSVRFISDTVDEMTLRALISRAGGEVVQAP